MAITDKATQVTDGGNPIVTTVTSARSPAGTSLSCDDLDNWPNDTVHFITYEKDANGLIDKTTQQDFKGIVSGNTIGSVTLKHSPTGSDLGNSIGDFVQMAPTASYGQDLYDHMTHEHDVDGNHASNMITDRTADNSPASGDSILTSDVSAADALKKVTLANLGSNGAWVDTGGLADGAATTAKTSFSTSTDANGWQIVELSTGVKIYSQRLTGSVSSLASLGTSSIASGNYPVGVTPADTKGIIVQPSMTGNTQSRYVFSVDNTNSSTAADTIGVSARNVTGSSLSETIGARVIIISY